VRTTRASVGQAKQVLVALEDYKDKQAQKLKASLEQFIPRVEQVIDQSRRRVFEGEKVPASEKIVSIFEPHTDIICRGKANKPVEFGHKVWLDEVEGGIVTDYRILDGNPARLLLDLDIAALDLGHEIRESSHIPMIICECPDPVQVRVLSDCMELLGDQWQVAADEPVTTNEQSLDLVPHRNQWGIDYPVLHAMHQVGGFPAWVQDPEYPTCASCGKIMSFVAQIDSSDRMGHCFWGDGMCYVFWCDDCAVSATLYQQT